MRAFWTCFLAASFLAAVGCGGGSGKDEKDDCGDVASKVVACLNNPPASLKAQIQNLCEAQDCTGGDKQAAIDCVMGLSCTNIQADVQTEVATCATQHGCTLPPM